jgi:hypothetical protein
MKTTGKYVEKEKFPSHNPQDVRVVLFNRAPGAPAQEGGVVFFPYPYYPPLH